MIYPYRESEGLLWRENFWSEEHVKKNNGANTGLQIGSGTCNCDGTNFIHYDNNYVQFAVRDFTLETTISRPVPNGAFQSAMRVGGSTSAGRMFFMGINPSNNLVAGSWSVYIDSGISVDPNGTYHMVLTYEVATSTLSFYVNGRPVGTAGPIGIDITSPRVTIGKSATGANTWEYTGLVHSSSFYSTYKTPEEVSQMYERSQFNYMNKASIWYDWDINGSNYTGTHYTVDKSNQGNLAILGDGVASGTYPVLRDNHYYFGLNDYMDLTASANYLSDQPRGSFVTKMQLHFVSGSRAVLGFGDSPNQQLLVWTSATHVRLRIATSAGLSPIAQFIPQVDEPMVIAGTYDGTDLIFYKNGVEMASMVHSGDFVTGSANNFINNADGLSRSTQTNYHFSLYDSALTPTQVRDISNYLLGRDN